MKGLLKRLQQALSRWYDKTLKVEPGELVWPQPPSVKPARARSRRPRRF